MTPFLIVAETANAAVTPLSELPGHVRAAAQRIMPATGPVVIRGSYDTRAVSVEVDGVTIYRETAAEPTPETRVRTR